MPLDQPIRKTVGLARACLVCSLIKSSDQFLLEGCDNCDEFLQMKNNRDRVMDCTSAIFDGMIALKSPEDSWIAKWQKKDKFTKGLYAKSVFGCLPAKFVKKIQAKGVTYRLRDTAHNQLFL